MKKCGKCNINKKQTEFYFRKDSNTYRTECRECTKSNRKAYVDKNRDVVYKKNLEYHYANKQVQNKKRNTHYKENWEHSREMSKQWKKNNPERYKALQRKSSSKRRALKYKVKENFTIKQDAFVFSKFNHKCFNCGSTEKLHIDHHRPLSKWNKLTIYNAVILCEHCNTSKGAKDPEDFYGISKCEEMDKMLIRHQVIFCIHKNNRLI